MSGQIVKYQGGELAYDPQNGLTPVRIEPQQVTSLQRAIAVIQDGPQKGQEATFYAAQNFAIELLGKEYVQHLASVSKTAIAECQQLRQEVRELGGQIIKHQGKLAYQDGDRIAPIQRKDLADGFLSICEAVERGLFSVQQREEAFQLLLREERKAQAEALATVTRLADTAIQTANQGTANSQYAFEKVVDIANNLIEAGKEKDRAIASAPKEVVYILDMPLWKTIEPLAYFFLLIVGLIGLIGLFTVNRQISQPTIPQPTIYQRSL